MAVLDAAMEVIWLWQLCLFCQQEMNMLQVVWVADMGSVRSYFQPLFVAAVLCLFCKYPLLIWTLLFNRNILFPFKHILYYNNKLTWSNLSFTSGKLSRAYRRLEARGAWKGWRCGGIGVQFSFIQLQCVLSITTCGGMGSTRAWHPGPDQVWVLHTSCPSTVWG